MVSKNYFTEIAIKNYFTENWKKKQFKNGIKKYLTENGINCLKQNYLTQKAIKKLFHWKYN